MATYKSYLDAVCHELGIRFERKIDSPESFAIIYEFSDHFGICHTRVTIDRDQLVNARRAEELIQVVAYQAEAQINEWLDEHAEG